MSRIPFEIGDEEDRKIILVDGAVFDWALDDESIEEANNHDDLRSVHENIKNHFLDSLGEILGFRPTMKQVNDAIKKGFIHDHS